MRSNARIGRRCRRFTSWGIGGDQLKRAVSFATILVLVGQGLGQSPASENHSAPNAPSAGRFVDVTEKLGIHFKQAASPTSKKYLLETMGSGVALFDYDNDGRLDIFFANGARIDDPTPKGTISKKDGAKYWNRLYHQKSDGNFEDVTEEAGVAGRGYSTGVAVGDYDNDGFDDLFVAGYGHSTLYHNNGDGTLTDVTAAAGVAGSGWATSAAWVDYDNDGKLDLVVARYMEWDFDDLLLRTSRRGIPFLLPSGYFQTGKRAAVSQRWEW